MITEEMLCDLRDRVAARLSEYRMRHTLGVEEAAARLAALYCPEKTALLRAAALLHDATKELTNEEQAAVFAAHGVKLRPDEAASPQVWHGMTAALTIPADFPAFAKEELIAAVRWHTTGRRGMTLTESLLYLADLIEENRTFPDCVALKNAFWDAAPAQMPPEERLLHLQRILLLSYEKTVSKLQAKGGIICLDSLAAMEELQNKRN